MMTLDRESEQLVSEIARRTGRSAAEVLRAAVTEHAVAVGVAPSGASSAEERFNAMLAIARRAAGRAVFDERSPDEIIGVNEVGLAQ